MAAAAACANHGVLLSFVAVTSLFILFADLLPKRVSMAKPEALAVRLLQPMLWCMLVLKPLVWLFDWLANAVVKIFRLPAVRDERITSDDILAMTKDGTRAGVLAQRAQQVIANVMDMNSRTVPSAMTQRDRIAYFLRDDPDHIIRARIAEEPYLTYPVCDGDIDHVIGYVDAKDLFQRALNNQPLSLKDGSLIRRVLIVPDKLHLGRSARPVPAGARRLCRDLERIQPGGGRGHLERCDEHGDGRSGQPRCR